MLARTAKDIQLLWGDGSGTYARTDLKHPLPVADEIFGEYVRKRRPERVASKNSVTFFLGDLASVGVATWERRHMSTDGGGRMVRFGLYVPSSRPSSAMHSLHVQLIADSAAEGIPNCQVGVQPLQWDGANTEWTTGAEYAVHDAGTIAGSLVAEGTKARFEVARELMALSGIVHRTLEIVQTAA